MGLLYGHAGRLTAQNDGFRPGQWASNIACKKLRQAVGMLRCVGELRDRQKTAFDAAVSAEFEQKRRIEELGDEIADERAHFSQVRNSPSWPGSWPNFCPFVAVCLQGCMGQPASFGPT